MRLLQLPRSPRTSVRSPGLSWTPSCHELRSPEPLRGWGPLRGSPWGCDGTSFLLDRHKDDLSIPVRGQVGAQSGPEGPTPWDPGGGSSEGRGQQGGSPGVGAGTLGCFQVPAPATDPDGDADAHTACPSSVSMRASHSASALRTSVYGKTPVLIGNRRRDDCDPGNSPLTFRKHSDRVSEDAKKICFG